MTKTDAFEERITETLRRKIAQLSPVTIAFDAAPLPTVVEPPRRGRSRVLVAATIALVLLLAAAVTVAVRRGNDAKQPAGPPSGPVVARLTLEAQRSLSLQAKELTTVAGVNEITLVSTGGAEALVFDDPALAYFRLSAPTGPSVGKVELQAGRDYRIHSFVPGHTAAGVDAVIHVLPAGAAGTPPLPAAVLNLVAARSTRADGPDRGAVEYTISDRKTANQVLFEAGLGDDQQSVYVFVLHGSFVANYAHPPRGLPLPTGHILTLVISQDSSPMTLDSGIGNPEPDLSLLGGAVKTHF